MNAFKGIVLAVWAVAAGLILGLVAGDIGARFSATSHSSPDSSYATGQQASAGHAPGAAIGAAPPEIAALIQKGTCVACHKPDSKLVGPSWQEIAARYDGKDALQDLTRKAKDGSQGTWGQVPMPPNTVLGESEVERIVEWVLTSTEAGDGEAGPAPDVEPAAVATASEADVLRGRELFEGRIRLAGGGAACNACHDVRNDAVLGGGILAAELTTAYSRIGDAGVRAILATPPFPVMQQAYKGRPLSEDEVAALTAFLQDADAHGQSQQPRNYGVRMLLSGVTGAIAMLGVCGVAWRRRRKQSVYQDIFDRQPGAE